MVSANTDKQSVSFIEKRKVNITFQLYYYAPLKLLVFIKQTFLNREKIHILLVWNINA
jgi:hypothetical protein